MAERGDRLSPSDDSFTHLRSIIVGPEQRELVALRAHVLDPTVQTRDVSRVLPDALQLRAHDPQLMRALAPSIEDAITASVKKDPQPLADALFPVIGPAIRRAVAHTFDAMIDSINQTIERTVSWRAMQWRFTAWRTGRPYAEVVLANTLEYRVEEVFLIHRETGLVLQHVASNPELQLNPDQVSAMMTALTDFGRDSFRASKSDSLENFRIGEIVVATAQGPHALIAAVFRGSIPLPVRETLENAVESIHRQFGPALQTFSGDATAFAEARPILEACLVSQRRRAGQRPSYRGWAITAALVLIAVAVGVYLDVRTRRAWDAYLDRLRSEPGIVVVSNERKGGKFVVSGLLDPLAADPATLLSASSSISADRIESRWEPYQALHPRFVATRATALLRPPQGVSLVYADGVLTATGSAPERWITESERLAPAIPGVRTFVFSGESRETQLKKQIDETTIRFAKAQSIVDPVERQALDGLVSRLKELDAVLASTGRTARLDVFGHADSDGPDDLNSSLSAARADSVASILRAAGLHRIELTARGLGRAPVTAGATETEHERNRRASFSVRIEDDLSPRRKSQ